MATESGSGSGGGAQLSARQRNRLAREARSSAAAAVGKPGGGSAKRRRGNDGNGHGGGRDGQEDGPPAFLGQKTRGSMLDVASNARETLVSLAADLVAQVRKDREWSATKWTRGGPPRGGSLFLFLRRERSSRAVACFSGVLTHPENICVSEPTTPCACRCTDCI